MRPYLVSISARRLSSWTIDNVMPVNTKSATTGMALAENWRSTAAAAVRVRHRRQRRQRADPVGDADAVEKTAIGRVSHCGAAVAACPLRPATVRRPPGARSTPRRSGPRALCARSKGDRSSRRSLSAGTAQGGVQPRFPRRRRDDTAGRKIEKVEPLQAERAHRADEAESERAAADTRRSARRCPIQAAKNAPPTPTNRPR